ncbi:hypothetical protein [Peribacillus simplex]|nr:hypothetical protein [Peribacillus simplex]WHY99140.1 hypothetical protein QNH37_08280 [Peribacillus simplex]
MQSITSGKLVSSPIEVKGSVSLENGQIRFFLTKRPRYRLAIKK